ncbi:MAG: type II toxin-antitoxin system HicB family antitoxin [bacterium]|nr:type II toxin-antitoxin system HicB family antitoxin [bacterium]
MEKTKKIKSLVKTTYGEFVVTFEREPDMGGFMVRVPKKPDVITWGKTKSHAERMAKEAIECSVEGEVLIAAEQEGLITIKKQRVPA